MRKYVLAASALAALAGCGSTEQAGEDTMAEQTSEQNNAVMAEPTAAVAPDGVTIRYDDQGAGAPTIVFVHGWSCDRGYWDAQRDHFASRYRVVTVDLAGHGESGDNREDFTMQAFGADVAAVVEALDLRNVVLVGHSMGGPVVLEAGNLLKGRVAAVVGVDTLRDVSRQVSPEEMAKRVARLNQDFVGDVRGVVESMFVEQSDATLRNQVVDDMSSAPPRVATSAMRGLSTYAATSSLANLGVPFALINSNYRPTNLEAIEAATGGFTAIEMSGVGHFVMMEDPATFNAHLEGIIQSLSL